MNDYTTRLERQIELAKQPQPQRTANELAQDIAAAAASRWPGRTLPDGWDSGINEGASLPEIISAVEAAYAAAA